MNNPALTKEAAAAYVGLSVSAFDEIVRPFVPFVTLDTPNAKRPPVRWLQADLDAYLAARRRAA